MYQLAGTQAMAPHLQVEYVSGILLHRLFAVPTHRKYGYILLNGAPLGPMSRNSITYSMSRPHPEPQRRSPASGNPPGSPPTGARSAARPLSATAGRIAWTPTRLWSAWRPHAKRWLADFLVCSLSSACARLHRFCPASLGGPGLRHVVDRDVHRLTATRLDGVRLEALVPVAFVSGSAPDGGGRVPADTPPSILQASRHGRLRRPALSRQMTPLRWIPQPPYAAATAAPPAGP